jgi:DNA-directed RNA polymerase specialized sigma24 family protein
VASFPITRISVVAAASSSSRDDRERALVAIAHAYWLPAYKYLRIRWRLGAQDAEDLTQDFFARATAEKLFARYDPSVSRFRTFIRTCLDSMVKNARVFERRLKRGGGATHLRIDPDGFARAEREIAGMAVSNHVDFEELFRREWLRNLFADALQDLRLHCESLGKDAQWAVFERYTLAAYAPGERPTYAMLGAELALPDTQVTNYLAYARREFRRLLLARLREQCANDAEYEAEARDLLGIEVR